MGPKNYYIAPLPTHLEGDEIAEKIYEYIKDHK